MSQAEVLESQYVFVYGSLKLDHGNNPILLTYGSEFMGEGITRDAKFDMESLGGFPGVFHNGDKAIFGEIWKINKACLIRLDALESHPRFYCRNLVPILSNDGGECQAWMYILPTRLFTFNGPGRRQNVDVFKIGEMHVANWNKPSNF